MIVRGTKLILDVVLFEEVLEFLWAFVVEAVELGFESAACQGSMDISYSRCEVCCFPCLDWPEKNEIAVVVVSNKQVVVSRT